MKLCPYGEGHARFGRVTIVITMTRCAVNTVTIFVTPVSTLNQVITFVEGGVDQNDW